MRLTALVPALLTVAAVASGASAATFTVDSTSDGADANPGDGICATAASTCTLRAAIEEANATADLDTIAFAISGSGVQTLSPTSALPVVTRPVILDGFTQPGSQPNTSPTGINAVPLIEVDLTGAGGMVIAGGNSTVRGLVLNGARSGVWAELVFRGPGGNTVEGCFIGTNATGTEAPRASYVGILLEGDTSADRIGGTRLADRNLISGHFNSGIEFSCSPYPAACHSGSVVAGNLIGTNAAGTAALPNNVGIRGRGATALTIGGTASSAGNVLAGTLDTFAAIELGGGAAHGAVIQNNRIGTSADGTQPLPNLVGVYLASDYTCPCGRPTFIVGGPGCGNVISFNAISGIITWGSNLTISHNTITSNALFGISVDGSTPSPYTGSAGTISLNTIESNGTGIALSGWWPGGDLDISDNSVAMNAGAGISLLRNSRARLGGNISRGNGGSGIDLNGDGVTPNDPGDGDLGPNGLQNFPVLTSACAGGGGVTVLGTLNSRPSSTFTIDFFRNAACDPTQYGEGETPLGGISIATGTDGSVSFVATRPGPFNVGEFITATATTPAGTSEFSRCVPVTNAAPPAQSISGPSSVCQGTPFVLRAVAGANSYQWFLDGVAIPGATGASFGRPAASPGDAGTYTVRASNCDLSSTSPPHGLSVVPCVAFPLRLDVDRHAVAGSASDLNGILEPAEVVVIEPRYQNTGSTALTLNGAATLTGPVGGVYALPDATADYGTVAAGQPSDCFGATGDCYRASVSAPSGRPMQHWDALLEETTSSGNPAQPWPVHVGETFGDVPRSHLFYRFVETLVHGSVTGGCSASDYCPGTSTTREQMAVFVLVAREGPFYAAPACNPAAPRFSDVPAESPFCPWIEELARRGIVSGCASNQYCPSLSVTREQMTVFALATREGTGYSPPACVAGSELFADVPASSAFCRWIEELARRGVVAGCGSGNFCPRDLVARGEMSVFIAGTFGLLLYGP